MQDPVDQFIEIAPDCELKAAVIPQERNGKPTIASIEYELLHGEPYCYTLQQLKFATYLKRKQIPDAKMKAPIQELWNECFAKSYACMRASPLTKQYGWGAHYDKAGRIAIYALDSAEYQRFVVDLAIHKFRAMRSKRA